MNKLTDKTNEVEELQKCIKALQAQIQSNQCVSTNNNLNREEMIATYKAQAESWKQKIDKIYNDIRFAQENYYMMSSKEKLLKLRTKYKECTEKSRKIFSMDSDCMKRVSKKDNNTFGVLFLNFVYFNRLNFLPTIISTSR